MAFALTELGIEHEIINIDLKGTAHKDPKFLALNPMGQVPTLVDGNQSMHESTACIIYLGEKYGVARGLWPEVGSQAHMQALTWLIWGCATLAPEIKRNFANQATTTDTSQHPNPEQIPKIDFAGMIKLLDQRLEGRDYILGQRFSLVDCYLSSITAWSTRMLKLDLNQAPNLQPWFNRCFEREAAKAMD